MIKGRQKEEADRENDREEVSKNIFRKAMFRDRFGPLFGLGGWLSCFWAVCALPLQAQRYVEVSAEIQSYTYKNGIIDRDTAFHRTIYAGCITSTNNNNGWRIDAELDDSEQKCFFDGTNVYLGTRGIDRMTTPIGPGPMRIKPFENKQPRLPTVGVHPISDGRSWGGEVVNIPWLAFCSGAYLKRPGRVVPLPVFYILNAAGANGCSDKMETFDDELGLPKTVELFTSSALYRSSVLEWNRAFLLNLPTNSSLPDGLLKFHYAVTASTNFLAWTFPLSFEYTEYEDDSNRPGVPVPVYGGVGKLTSIGVSAKPENPCSPGFSHTVLDYRMRNDTNVQAIIYTSTNPSVAPTNSPDLQNKLARLAASLSSPEQRRRKEWFVRAPLVLLAFLLLLPLAYKFFRSSVQNRATSNE